MRIDDALKHGTSVLLNESDTARLDSEILLAHFLGKSRSYLYTWPEVELSDTILSDYNEALNLRKTQFPIAYITGFQEFWSLRFIVSPDVLIPRADTELLVETALEKLQGIQSPKILELGTGSGAIALALASERPDSQIIACDNSRAALDIATLNKNQLALQNVSFIKSDWFDSIADTDFDLILSNPPYIDPDDNHMSTSIRHEPYAALCAEDHGLADLSKIIKYARHYMKPSSWLLLEHGYDQGALIPRLLEDAGYQHSHCLKDLSGNDRISLGQYSLIPASCSGCSIRPITIR